MSEAFDKALEELQDMNAYGDYPVNPLYVAEPSKEIREMGLAPGDALPAQYWNFYVRTFVKKLNALNDMTLALYREHFSRSLSSMALGSEPNGNYLLTRGLKRQKTGAQFGAYYNQQVPAVYTTTNACILFANGITSVARVQLPIIGHNGATDVTLKLYTMRSGYLEVSGGITINATYNAFSIRQKVAVTSNNWINLELKKVTCTANQVGQVDITYFNYVPVDDLPNAVCSLDVQEGKVVPSEQTEQFYLTHGIYWLGNKVHKSIPLDLFHVVTTDYVANLLPSGISWNEEDVDYLLPSTIVPPNLAMLPFIETTGYGSQAGVLVDKVLSAVTGDDWKDRGNITAVTGGILYTRPERPGFLHYRGSTIPNMRLFAGSAGYSEQFTLVATEANWYWFSPMDAVIRLEGTEIMGDVGQVILIGNNEDSGTGIMAREMVSGQEEGYFSQSYLLDSSLIGRVWVCDEATQPSYEVNYDFGKHLPDLPEDILLEIEHH